jgi:hypothetical protein
VRRERRYTKESMERVGTDTTGMLVGRKTVEKAGHRTTLPGGNANE